MTVASLASILEAGRVRSGLTAQGLWLGYCAIGGQGTPEAIDRFLDGRALPDRGDYDVIVQALNDACIEGEAIELIPYAEELDGWPGA